MFNGTEKPNLVEVNVDYYDFNFTFTFLNPFKYFRLDHIATHKNGWNRMLPGIPMGPFPTKLERYLRKFFVNYS